MLSPDMQRMEKIRDYCVRVENAIDRFGNKFDSFRNDIDYQMVVSFCILQIGELSGALSMEYREATASRIQWGPIKGMRNWAAHRYAA